MSESLEHAAWETPLTRRDVLVKGAVAGGVLAAGGVLSRSAYARPTAAWIARQRAASVKLFVANYGDMQNLDPHTSSADTVTGDILTNLYSIPATFVVPSALGPRGVAYADPNKFRGQAVRGWSVSKSGTEVTFTARTRIKVP